MSSHLKAPAPFPWGRTLPEHEALLTRIARASRAVLARRRRGTAKLALAGVSAFLIGIGVGSTQAAWTDAVTLPTTSVQSGALALVYGDCAWQRVTPGYDTVEYLTSNPSYEPPAGVACGADLVLPTSVPGDMFEYRLAVTTHLAGDNLAAELRVALGDAAAAMVATGELAVELHIENEYGTLVAAIAEDAPTEVQIWLGATDNPAQNWMIVVRVKVLGDYQWAASFAQQTSGTWSLGALNVELAQVRAGA